MDAATVLCITIVIGDVGARLAGGRDSLLRHTVACAASIGTGVLCGLRVEHDGDASVPIPLSPVNFVEWGHPVCFTNTPLSLWYGKYLKIHIHCTKKKVTLFRPPSLFCCFVVFYFCCVCCLLVRIHRLLRRLINAVLRRQVSTRPRRHVAIRVAIPHLVREVARVELALMLPGMRVSVVLA